MQSKNFHAKVWKVFLENTTTWKIKSSTSSLDLCAPTKFAQIAVMVASKAKRKSSMTDGSHQNGATGKNMKRYQPVKNACHKIQVVKAFHSKFKAKLSWITAVLKLFAMEFNCVGNHFLKEIFSEIS